MKKLINLGLISLGLALAPSIVMAVEKAAAPAASQPVGTVDNQTLKFQLAAKLNELYPNNNIEVTAFNNTILLTGQVASKTIKHGVNAVAAKFSGVEALANYLAVAKKQSAAQTAKDSWITTKATAKLVAIHGIDSSNVKIVTSNGSAYLLGTVTHSQDAAIIKAITPINGIRKIIILFKFNKGADDE